MTNRKSVKSRLLAFAVTMTLIMSLGLFHMSASEGYPQPPECCCDVEAVRPRYDLPCGESCDC